MSQVERKWITDSAVNNDKLDSADSYEMVDLNLTGRLDVTSDASVVGNLRVDGTTYMPVIESEIVVFDKIEINQTDDQEALLVSQDNTAAISTVLLVENVGSGYALTVDQGFVGLGTTDPQSALEVVSDTPFNLGSSKTGNVDTVFLTDVSQGAGDDNVGASIGFSGPGSANDRGASIASVQQGADSDVVGLGFYTHVSTGGATNLVEAMRIDRWSSTRASVGINKSAPEGILHVQDDSAGSISPTASGDLLVLEDNASNGMSIFSPDVNNGNIYFGSPSENENVRLTGAYNGGSPSFKAIINGDQIAQFDQSKLTVGLTVDANESATLHVNTASAGTITADSNADQLVVENSSHGGISILAPNNAYGSVYFGSPSDPVGSLVSWRPDLGEFVIGTHYAGADLVFDTNDGDEAVRILANGNVGIGITNPTVLLHVDGSVIVEDNFTVNGTLTTVNTEVTVTDRLEINQNDNQEALIVSQDGGGNTATVMKIENAGNGYALTVDTGRVGLGVTNPASNLEVAGTDSTLYNPAATQINEGVTFRIGNKDTTLQTFSQVELSTNSAGSTAYVRLVALATSSNSAALAIVTEGTGTRDERMRITAGGYVGIGTNNPQRLLHIHNDAATATSIQITNSDTTPAVNKGFQLGIDDNEFAKIWQYENLPMYFGTNNLEAMRINGNGNIGVGTNIPERKLHVFKGSAGTVTALSHTELVVENSGSAGLSILTPDANSGVIYFGSPTASAAEGQITYTHSGAPSAHLRDAMSFTTTGSRRMIINNNGDVGIGLDIPRAKLDVIGNIYVGTVDLTNSHANTDWNEIVLGGVNLNRGITIVNGVNGSGGIAFSDGTVAASQARGLLAYDHGNNSMRFHTDNIERMRINNAGNVGIGIGDPQSILHVGSNSPSIKIQDIDSNGSGATGFVEFVQANNSSIGYMGFGSSGNVDITVKNHIAGGHIVVDPGAGGNVGIGITNPQALLEVSGSSATAVVSTVSNTNATDGNRTQLDLTTYDPVTGQLPGVQLISNNISHTYALSNSEFSINVLRNTVPVERLRIDSQGNMGLGADPTEKLHLKNDGNVAQYALFQNDPSSGDPNYDKGLAVGVDVGGYASIWNRNNTNMNFGINDAQAMILNYQGRLGVGDLLTPRASIHSHNTSTNSESLIKFTNGTTGIGTTGVAGNTGLTVGLNDSNQPVIWGSNDSHMVFATNNTSRFTIKANGDVGVGGYATEKFEVFGTSKMESIVIKGDGDVGLVRDRTNASLTLWGGTASNGARLQLYGDTHDSMANKTVFYNPDGGRSMTITADGKVGINSSSPATFLDVAGAGRFSGGLAVTGSTHTDTVGIGTVSTECYGMYTLTGNTANFVSPTSTLINLPSGYTFGNTMILACNVYNGTEWQTAPLSTVLGVILNAILTNANQVRIDVLNDAYRDKLYKVVLYKFAL